MKKITLVTIGVTGALILTTAATAMAAPSVRKEQAENDTQTILSSSTAKSAPTELPEKFQDLELPEGITLSDNKEETDLTLPEKPESEDMKPFTEGSGFKSAFVPKLKPETKPEGKDMVPPEFEGIENIDQLGRPEFSEEEMPKACPVDLLMKNSSAMKCRKTCPVNLLMKDSSAMKCRKVCRKACPVSSTECLTSAANPKARAGRLAKCPANPPASPISAANPTASPTSAANPTAGPISAVNPTAGPISAVNPLLTNSSAAKRLSDPLFQD